MPSERTKNVKEGINEAITSLHNILMTSYGPKGLDKMIKKGKKCTITNDGATILNHFKNHPIHRVISDMSHTQDVNCGDGTTTVVLLACILYNKINQSHLVKENNLTQKFMETFEFVKQLAVKHIDEIKVPASDIMSAALTALNSKIANKNVNMAKIAIEALSEYDMKDIKIFKKVGGSIEDISMFGGVALSTLKSSFNSNITSNSKSTYKTILAQFCISAPKTNMDAKINIKDYKQMEQFVREETEYLSKIVKKIKEAGVELVIVQKSMLKESVSALAMHLLKKENINVIDGIERNEIAYLSEKMKVNAVADVDILMDRANNSNNLNNAKYIKEVEVSMIDDTHVNVKCEGCCTISVDGVDEMVVAEGERCLNDVLCVLRSLKNDPFIVPGGCAVETGIGIKIEEAIRENKIKNVNMFLLKEIAESLYELGHALANNAGYYAVETVEKLKSKIFENWNLGISMRKNKNFNVSDMVNEDNVIQPAYVSKSAVILALETVQMIVKIDDILPSKNMN